jgi:hypothetical protein
MDYPMCLNLFEFIHPDQKDFLIQETINMLYKLYDPQHQGIMGPRYEHLFRNAALTVMADPAGGTFVDIPKLFRDPKFVQQKLKYVTDMNVLEFWNKEMPQSQRSNDFGEVVSWFVSKFGAFVSNEMMRNIIGQPKSAFDLRDIMDNKKILLVNLSKGRVGDLNSKLLGMIFVMKFQAAAMSRANIPESERQDFCLYVDEFQNFSTDSFATIMSEARKYHLNLIVANQFTTQLTEEIRDAVFGNMGTIVSFRIGQNDVESLSRYFQPTFDGDDLLRIPSYNAIVRTLVGGVPTNPFSMSTLAPLGSPNPKLADALKQLSAAKYGHPKAEVEKDIFARMATTPDAPKPAFGSGSAGTMAGGMNPAMRPGAGYPQAAAPPQPAQTGWGSAGITANPAQLQAVRTQPPAPQAMSQNPAAAMPGTTQTGMPMVNPAAAQAFQPQSQQYAPAPLPAPAQPQPMAPSLTQPVAPAMAQAGYQPQMQPPQPVYAQPMPAAQQVPAPLPAQAPVAGPAPTSFLDDWLSKRQQLPATPVAAPATRVAVPQQPVPQPEPVSRPDALKIPRDDPRTGTGDPSEMRLPRQDEQSGRTESPQAGQADQTKPEQSASSEKPSDGPQESETAPEEEKDTIYIDENGALQYR